MKTLILTLMMAFASFTNAQIGYKDEKVLKVNPNVTLYKFTAFEGDTSYLAFYSLQFRNSEYMHIQDYQSLKFDADLIQMGELFNLIDKAMKNSDVRFYGQDNICVEKRKIGLYIWKTNSQWFWLNPGHVEKLREFYETNKK